MAYCTPSIVTILVCASESIAAEYIPLPSDIQDVNVVNPVITGCSPVPYADSVMGIRKLRTGNVYCTIEGITSFKKDPVTGFQRSEY